MDDSVLKNAILDGSLDTVESILIMMYRKYYKPYNYKLENNGVWKNQSFGKCKDISKFFLFQEIDLNFPNSKYSLLLHFVMMHGDEETFRFSLLAGKNFDLNSLGPEKQTILHHAVYKNKTDCIKYLIQFGMDINIGDHENKTALHYAVRKNNPEIVNYLLSLGADVNKKMDKSGYTALHIAVVMRNKEIIDILLKSGADIKAKCESGRRTELNEEGVIPINYYESSVLNFVCGRSVLRQHLSFPGINFPSLYSPDSKYACNWKRIIFDKEMIEFLLERGAETEIYDFSYSEDSATPLQRACQVGRLNIVKLLLKYGASPYTKDCFERTVIFYAVQTGDYRIVDAIHMKSQDLNAIDKYGQTPLYYYIYKLVTSSSSDYKKNYRFSMLDYLVDNGADINVKVGNFGDTPLLLALSLNNPHLIESLLELKADFTDQNLKFEDAAMKVIIAYKALNEFEFNEVEESIQNWKKDFFVKCRLEVEKMKMINISLKRHSLYQFLVDNLLEVSKYRIRGGIAQILETFVHNYEFPCYELMLHKRVERVEELFSIQNYLKNFLKTYAKMMLPVLVIEKILSYLSLGDLRNFGRTKFFLKRENDVIFTDLCYPSSSS